MQITRRVLGDKGQVGFAPFDDVKGLQGQSGPTPPEYRTASTPNHRCRARGAQNHSAERPQRAPFQLLPLKPIMNPGFRNSDLAPRLPRWAPVSPPILVKLLVAGATRAPHNMPCSRLEISSIRKRVVESTTLLSFVQLRWLAGSLLASSMPIVVAHPVYTHM